MAHQPPRLEDTIVTRRELLCRSGMGMGALALGNILAEKGLLGQAARAADGGAPGPARSAIAAVNPLLPKASPLEARAKRYKVAVRNLESESPK